MTNVQKPRNHRTNALLAQLLAQVKGSRSGERVSRSGEGSKRGTVALSRTLT